MNNNQRKLDAPMSTSEIEESTINDNNSTEIEESSVNDNNNTEINPTIEEIKNAFRMSGKEFKFTISSCNIDYTGGWYDIDLSSGSHGNSWDVNLTGKSKRKGWSVIDSIPSDDNMQKFIFKIFSEHASSEAKDYGTHYKNLTPKKHGYDIYHPYAGPIYFLSETDKNGIGLYSTPITASNNDMLEWLEKLTKIINNKELKELTEVFLLNTLEIRDKIAEKVKELEEFMWENFRKPGPNGTFKVFEKSNYNNKLKYCGFVTVEDGKEIESQDGGSLSEGDIYIPVSYGAGFYASEKMAKGADRDVEKFIENVYLPNVGESASLSLSDYEKYCRITGISDLIKRNNEIIEKINKKLKN